MSGASSVAIAALLAAAPPARVQLSIVGCPIVDHRELTRLLHLELEAEIVPAPTPNLATATLRCEGTRATLSYARQKRTLDLSKVDPRARTRLLALALAELALPKPAHQASIAPPAKPPPTTPPKPSSRPVGPPVVPASARSATPRSAGAAAESSAIDTPPIAPRPRSDDPPPLDPLDDSAPHADASDPAIEPGASKIVPSAQPADASKDSTRPPAARAVDPALPPTFRTSDPPPRANDRTPPPAARAVDSASRERAQAAAESDAPRGRESAERAAVDDPGKRAMEGEAGEAGADAKVEGARAATDAFDLHFAASVVGGLTLFTEVGPPAFGGRMAIEIAPSWFGARLDAGAYFGSEHVELGDVSLLIAGAGLCGFSRFTTDIVVFDIGAGARGGYARVRGRPGDPAQTEGATVSGAWIGPLLGGRATFDAGPLQILAELEAGLVIRPVVGRAEGATVAAADGAWFGFHLGLGLEP